MCVGVLATCMSVYLLHMYLVPIEARKGCQILYLLVSVLVWFVVSLCSPGSPGTCFVDRLALNSHSEFPSVAGIKGTHHHHCCYHPASFGFLRWFSCSPAWSQIDYLGENDFEPPDSASPFLVLGLETSAPCLVYEVLVMEPHTSYMLHKHSTKPAQAPIPPRPVVSVYVAVLPCTSQEAA